MHKIAFKSCGRAFGVMYEIYNIDNHLIIPCTKSVQNSYGFSKVPKKIVQTHFVQIVRFLCKIVQPYCFVFQTIANYLKPLALLHDFFLDF